jgi:formylglycine-generating enzyme required for sulfatase activity
VSDVGSAIFDDGNMKPNPWGIYHVHFTIWEWCEDIWHENYSGAPANGMAWLQGGHAKYRVARGGDRIVHPPLRAAFRHAISADVRVPMLGFRVARILVS